MTALRSTLEQVKQQRVLVPERVFDQRVMTAVEREKLAGLILDDPGILGRRALRNIIQVLGKSPQPRRQWLPRPPHTSIPRQRIPCSQNTSRWYYVV